MDLLLEAVGWLGAALLLAGYALVSSARLNGDGLRYQLINLVGSISLMINSAYNDAWPSAGLNLVWAAIGVVALVKLARLARTRRRWSPT
ncbi:CBU_0592 family membrane protein [Nonomuraea sp. CA-218870]|uniref:CBU_0592 family membrane protein n=1 Tax=Nonomuraea sp. CA-218870 TaxID=3239998 RepID=UPI003D93FA59